MDCKRIIENGYGKLAEKLPAYETGVLDGFKFAIESLKNYKDNIGDFVLNDVKTIARIEREVAECTIDNAIEWVDTTHDEILISFVDNNHYSIDENGNIYDDNEGEQDE